MERSANGHREGPLRVVILVRVVACAWSCLQGVSKMSTVTGWGCSSSPFLSVSSFLVGHVCVACSKCQPSQGYGRAGLWLLDHGCCGAATSTNSWDGDRQDRHPGFWTFEGADSGVENGLNSVVWGGEGSGECSGELRVVACKVESGRGSVESGVENEVGSGV